MLISTVLLKRKKKKKRGQLDTRNKGMYSDTTFLLQLKCMLATLCSNFPAALCYQYNKAHMNRESSMHPWTQEFCPEYFFVHHPPNFLQ